MRTLSTLAHTTTSDEPRDHCAPNTTQPASSTSSSASKGPRAEPRAEPAPRDEACKREIDERQHHELELTEAAMGDHRADHEQSPADGGHRHHDRCDVEHGGQDQANRSQELEDPEGLDEADAGVLGPLPAIMLGQCLL